MTDYELRLEAAGECGWTLEQTNVLDGKCWHLNGVQSETAPPDYTTDYNDAFALVEVLRKEGWDFKCQCGSGWWEACFLATEDLEDKSGLVDPSLPRAITKAFLKARGRTNL